MAYKRIKQKGHGTTRKIPEEEFLKSEKQVLKELPIDDFIFSKSNKVSIQSNCHISYGGNYYSAPYGYIGCEVDVIEINNLLKIYFKGDEIALHSLCQDSKGKHITNIEHYPASKNITSKEIQSYQFEKMQEIGENASLFFYAFSKKSKLHKYEYRTISGILALRKKYSDSIIDNACKRAMHYSSITYSTVKKICEKGLISLPVEGNESFVNEDETSFSRNLASYNQISMMGVIENE